MTHTQTDVFFYEDGRFEEGYKPGTIRMRMDNGMGGVNVHIMTEDPREQLSQLRDLCQSQIEALDAHYVAMASMPADPPPLPLDAPIEQVASPQDHIEQTEFVPVMTLPGHPANCCCDDCVPF